MTSKFCPNCGNKIYGDNFCGKCGSSASTHNLQSNASSNKTLSQPNKMEINIVCPLCLSQNVLLANSEQSNNFFVCPNCKGSFSSRVVNIRSKNSRGSKKENKRNFSVRIIEFNGNEDLIEFANSDYEDFEMRAKDLAIFSYVNSNLMVIQNSTVGQYKKISKSSCYVATYVYGINSVEV